MKKIVAISILTVYVALSLLEVVSLHFCHNKLVSVSVTTPKQKCCITPDKQPPGCCENVVIDVNFDSDHLASTSQNIVTPDFDSAKIASPFLLITRQQVMDKLDEEPSEPVPKLNEDRFILYSFFLIYS